MITAERYHDISCGHRVAGHESKCRHMHGHNYRVHFTVEAAKGLDDIGRVLDFSVIKSKLCMWLEDNWDHKFLAWEEDKLMSSLLQGASNEWQQGWLSGSDHDMLRESIVWTPFNPTAENMAQYLVQVIGPQQLEGTGCTLSTCRIEETRKCSASFSLW